MINKNNFNVNDLKGKNDFSDIINSIAEFNDMADLYGAELATKQLELEHEAFVLGESRFMKALERAVDRKELADNVAAKPLVQHCVDKLTVAVSEFLTSKGRGRPHVALKYLSELEPVASATIAVKTVLQEIARFAERQDRFGAGSIKRNDPCMDIRDLGTHIGNAIADELQYGRIRDIEVALWKSNIEPNLNKRNGMIYKQAYMSAVEQALVAEGTLTKFPEIPPEDKMYIGLKLIELINNCTAMLSVEVLTTAARESSYTGVYFSEAFSKLMAERAISLAGMSPMYQPCVVPPKPWTGLEGGGYWASGRRPLKLIRKLTKRGKRRYEDVDMPNVYRAVNLAQNTAWKINKRVLNVVNVMMEQENAPVDGIPTVNKAPKPARLEGMDDDPVILKKWKRAAAAVFRKERARESRRLSVEFRVEQANKFAEYDAIYFPYNLDWRGRVYAASLFNPQGTDLVKGMLTFSKGERIGSEGGYWLAVHGANCAGFDKADLDERVQWVKDHESEILKCADNPLDNLWWTQQDSPFCFLAFCFEWQGYKLFGEDFESSLPLAFDGTCSGLQHFSAMLRDAIGGKAVNLMKGYKRQDIYGIVAEKVNVVLDELLVTGTDNEAKTKEDKKTGEIIEYIEYGTKVMAQWWKEYGVTRGVTKRSVMTLAYGSKEYGFADQIREDTVQPAIDDGKGDMFLHVGQACRFMAKLIWEAVSTTVVAAVEVMNWLQRAAKLLATDVKDKDGNVIRKCQPTTWTTPVGFPVWQEYVKFDSKRLNLVFNGKIVVSGEAVEGKVNIQPTINQPVPSRGSVKIDANKQAAGIAPNFVHSNDASHLMLTVIHGHDAYGITNWCLIHDSFGTNAAKAGLLFKAVRETMVKTYTDHDVIQEFYDQFYDQLDASQLKKMPPIPAKGELDINEILESEFCFS